MLPIKTMFGAGLIVSAVAGFSAEAGSLTEVNAGDVNTNRQSGDVAIGNYFGSRISIDDNEIQAQSCAREPCNSTTLYLQHEGGPLYIGGNGTSQMVLQNPDETKQRIRFVDVQNGQEFVHLEFNSGLPDRGLTVSARDDAQSADYEFRPSGQAYKIGGGSWSTLSDRRVKQDIHNFTVGLDALLKINPVTYRFNGKGETPRDGRQHVGVIAQDIHGVKGLEEVTLQSEKRYLDASDEKQSELLTFDPSALIYVAINAIKELETEVALLKAKNRELEKKIGNNRGKF